MKIRMLCITCGSESGAPENPAQAASGELAHFVLAEWGPAPIIALLTYSVEKLSAVVLRKKCSALETRKFP